MDISTSDASPLRQRMLDAMCRRKMDEQTRGGHLRAVRKLAAFVCRLRSALAASSPDQPAGRPLW